MLRSLFATIPFVLASSAALAQNADSPQPVSFAYMDLQTQTESLTNLQYETQFDGRTMTVTGIVSSVRKVKELGYPDSITISLDELDGKGRNAMSGLNIVVSCDMSPDGPYANTALGLNKGDSVSISGKARARARFTRKSLTLNACSVNSVG